jgi:hypothetical protein
MNDFQAATRKCANTSRHGTNNALRPPHHATCTRRGKLEIVMGALMINNSLIFGVRVQRDLYA